MPRPIRTACECAVLVAFISIAGCSGDAQTTPTGPDPQDPPAPGLSLRFVTEPQDAVAGEPLQSISVAVVDGSGQTATATSGSIVVALSGSTGATLGGTTTATLSGGVATFGDLNITRAGSGYTLVASGAGAAARASATFAISPAPAVELVWTEAPGDVPLGETFSLAVEAHDPYGNRVTDSGSPVSARLEHPTLSAVDLGTASLSTGEARWTDVAPRLRDRGYTVRATWEGLEAASPAFDVFLPVLDIDVGYTHGCAVADAHSYAGDPVQAGYVYCWGSNEYGQIRSRMFTAAARSDRPLSYALDPRTATLRAVEVAVGVQSTCARTPAGAVYCWGGNQGGELGQSDQTPRALAVQVGGVGTWSTLDGGAHHYCGFRSGVLDEGRATCWGSNLHAEVLFNGDRFTVFGPTITGPSDASEVTAGNAYTCVRVAVRATCWGRPNDGRLGGGSTGQIPELDQLPAALQFAAIDAGGEQTCGLDAAGVAYCWGRGPLGDGTVLASSEPSRVLATSGTTFTSITAGWEHSCALDTEGAAHCWGTNDDGQTGQLIGATTLVPSPVPGGLRFTQLSVGRYVTCGITAERRAYCWGWGKQLGNEGLFSTNQPTPIN